MSHTPSGLRPPSPLRGEGTRDDAIAGVRKLLEANGVDDAAREARLILRAAAGLTAADLIRDPQAPLDPDALLRLHAFAARRAAREPLSRILGQREFWSLPLAIDPAVLDPRADTETLVAAALAAFAGRRGEALRLLDLGTGSGAILCALLKVLPDASGVAVDLSPDAARVARANLAACGLAARSLVVVGAWGDCLAPPSPSPLVGEGEGGSHRSGRNGGEAAQEQSSSSARPPSLTLPHKGGGDRQPAFSADGRYDLIVSNPPYIATGEIAGLDAEVRDHDPHLALDGGPDGLAAYRALAPALARLLAPDGRFFVEIGAGQAERVTAIFFEAGLRNLAALPDLSDRDRVIAGARPFSSEAGEGVTK